MQADVLAQKDAKEKPTKDKSAKEKTTKAKSANKELVFPEIEGWEKSGKTQYPQSELGYSVNYESEEGGRITVYVYDMGMKKIESGVEDKNVVAQLNKAESEIKQIAELGYYDNVKKVKSETITLGGDDGKVKSLYTLYELTARGNELTSEIHLFGHNNKFIKFRATRAREETKSDFIMDFLKEMDKLFAE